MSDDPNRDFSRPELALASCFWCEGLHESEHPLSVCGACAAGFSTLRRLEMSGSYPLTEKGVDAMGLQKSAGNYALGYLDDGRFEVFYVGRSDSDVKQRLRDWIGRPSRFDRRASTGMAPWQLGPGGHSPVGGAADDQRAWGDGYTRFAYSYSPSPEEAYAQEWRNYDAFGGDRALDNRMQPVALVA